MLGEGVMLKNKNRLSIIAEYDMQVSSISLVYMKFVDIDDIIPYR